MERSGLPCTTSQQIEQIEQELQDTKVLIAANTPKPERYTGLMKPQNRGAAKQKGRAGKRKDAKAEDETRDNG